VIELVEVIVDVSKPVLVMVRVSVLSGAVVRAVDVAKTVVVVFWGGGIIVTVGVTVVLTYAGRVIVSE